MCDCYHQEWFLWFMILWQESSKDFDRERESALPAVVRFFKHTELLCCGDCSEILIRAVAPVTED